MLILRGKYNEAVVYTENIDTGAISEVINLCNQEFTVGSKIRIMPDVHKGAGCVIGTTMTITDKVVPNIVGVDIGCGMLTVELGKKEIDLERLDKYINENIPSGYYINEEAQIDYTEAIKGITCIKKLTKTVEEFNRGLGSLGGGNHFIEVGADKDGNKYLVIHSGSRNLGNQVAKYHQNKAYEYHTKYKEEHKIAKTKLIQEYSKKGKQKEIGEALKDMDEENKKHLKIPKELSYLEGVLKEEYMDDLEIVQKYAEVNREVMAERIVREGIGLEYKDLAKFQTIHNYIDTKNNILRKGAISAQEGEKVLIPINMRDGCIIAVGKGNPEWNYSAPHGAGRLFSRSEAKEVIDLEEFKETMKEVYTTSVSIHTLDEAPEAYKPIEEILKNIVETVDVQKVIKPIYNYKS